MALVFAATGLVRIVGIVLLVGGLSLQQAMLAAKTYEPPIPRSLSGYRLSKSFDPQLHVAVARTEPDGSMYLTLRFQATRASFMQFSTEAELITSSWQPYTSTLSNWRVLPQRKPLTIYAVFKRPRASGSANLPHGSVISPIVHYTLQLDAPERVVERTETGYIDWTEQLLVVNAAQLPANLDTAQQTALQLQHLQTQALAKLELRTLQALEALRVSPGVTIGDNVYLGTLQRAQLLAYLPLLQLTELNYKSAATAANYPYRKNVLGGAGSDGSALSQLLKTTLANEPLQVQLSATLSLLSPSPSPSPSPAGSAQRSTISTARSIYRELQAQLPAQPQTNTIAPVPFVKHDYKALVIDLRGLRYEPTLFPHVVTANGLSVLTGAAYAMQATTAPFIASTPVPVSTIPLPASPAPYVRYVRNIAADNFPRSTLFIAAAELTVSQEAIVIADFYGELLRSDPAFRTRVANGAFWLVVD